MPSPRGNGESGRSLVIVGWILVLLALLVMFYIPVAVRPGGRPPELIAGAMVVAGVLLNILGFRGRRRSY